MMKMNFYIPPNNIGANLAIYRSETEVLKKRDIGSKSRNFLGACYTRDIDTSYQTSVGIRHLNTHVLKKT